MESASFRSAGIVLSLLAGACGGDTTGTRPGDETSDSGAVIPLVSVDPSSVHQTLVGFGASTAWFLGALVNHPNSGQLNQLLFSELGLDVLRFRNRYQRRDEPVDLQEERHILEVATESLGTPPTVIMTSWSPPAALKANGNDDCRGESTCTLMRRDGEFVYEEFADYWFDSLEAYAEIGIVPDYISIQNEPDFLPNGWEGCRFAPTESQDDQYPGYDRALEAVHARIAALDTSPKLLGPETLGVHWGRAASYLDGLDRDLIDGVAHHLYEMGGDGVWDWRQPGPDSYAGPLRETADAAGELPTFQTEFQTDGDASVEGGFETAWLIHNSLVEGNASAWLYWNLIWGIGQDGSLSGLVTLSDDDYKVRDQYYALRHYSLYTQPGDVRVDAESEHSSIRASAFLSVDGDRLTIVLLNVGQSSRGVKLDVDAFGAERAEAFLTVFRPGESERWVELGEQSEVIEPKADDESPAQIDMPSRSVVTLLLTR